MRKPNGYGTIKKLSGQRRRPYVFCVSKHACPSAPRHDTAKDKPPLVNR